MVFFLCSIFILSLYPLSLFTSRNGWVKPLKPTWKWRASLRLKGARNILVTLTPVKTTVSAQGRVPNTPVSANLGGLVTTVIRILMNALEVLISFTYFNNPVFWDQVRNTRCKLNISLVENVNFRIRIKETRYLESWKNYLKLREVAKISEVDFV